MAPKRPPHSTTTRELDGGDARGRLVAIAGEIRGQTYTIGPTPATLGRDENAEVPLTDSRVSRQHARITPLEDTWLIEDLGSRNGTRLNGQPLTRTERLQFGDKIELGWTAFIFNRYDPLDEQLMQLQKLESIGQIAGGVAHDFNNLLVPILTGADMLDDMLQKDALTAESARSCISAIRGAARAAVELTQQLLGFVRPQSTGMVRVQLSRVIDDVVKLCSRTFPPEINFKRPGPSKACVVGDAGQLHQVLLNLCVNARDAMTPDGGELEIVIDESPEAPRELPTGNYVAFEVRDTGCGMDAYTAKRVFQPFFSTKTNKQGTGLGLATVNTIVQNHGGRISVESKVGHGAAFRVVLPSVPPGVNQERADASGSFRMGEHGTRARHLLLLVDDERWIRESTQRLLLRLGYEVICAADGVEAVELFREHRHMLRLVILDLVMPAMGGMETLKRMRELDPEVPVLISSGHLMPSNTEQLTAEGAVGFLRKPYGARTLETAVVKAIDADAPSAMDAVVPTLTDPDMPLP